MKPSCQDATPQTDLLHPDIAIKQMLAQINPVRLQERVQLRSSLCRVLSEDITAGFDIPPWENSAMDGYALAYTDADYGMQQGLAVAGTSLAGKPFEGSVPAKSCVSIMTGAQIPEGTDCVVIKEQVAIQEGRVYLQAPIQHGQNIRAQGEDIKHGETVLQQGTRITPAELGVLASLGLSEVPLWHRPLVAFFSTGDELQSIGNPPHPNKIFDSNRYTLIGMLQRLGVRVCDMGIIKDDPQALEEAVLTASQEADLIISSGGVSVGDADFVKQVISQHGKLDLWRIAIKPGRPLSFGRIGKSHFLGLPGNPVSVMITFYQFAQPVIRKLMGEHNYFLPQFTAICQSLLQKMPGRIEYQRGILSYKNGKLVVHKTGAQGSGVLKSMTLANCLMVLPYEVSVINIGDTVTVQPFSALV